MKLFGWILGFLMIANIAAANDEIYCLQQNIYFESGNQPTMGQTAVAWVTLNRMSSSNYPNSVCEVVWQKSQFDWTSDGKSDEPPTNHLDVIAWNRAGMIAELTYEWWQKGNDGPIGGAVMFHADYVDPYWKSSYEKVVKLGNHIFYKEKEI